MLTEISALYITLAILTICLCTYVVISYIRNKHFRKPPAGLMLSKTFSDLLFSVLFFLMVIQGGEDDSVRLQGGECQFYGPIFLLVFITAQFYFTAMCWDLYRTLRNPFRKPSADSIKIHISVWIIGAILVGIVAIFDVFEFRSVYGICYTCNTGKSFNIWNIILVYIPLGSANIAGISVTVYAFRRLASGLEKTFELRQLNIYILFINISQ